MAGLPRIIVTAGEPAGIGPDLCVALAQQSWPCEVVVAADRRVLGARARQLGRQITIHDYSAGYQSGAGSLCVAHFSAPNPVLPGKLDPGNAHHVLELLDYACDGCRRGEFAAMVTAPVQKSIIQDAGFEFSGHTEYLAARCDATPVMLLTAGQLRVALVTTHLPLQRVPAAITQAAIRQVATVLDRDLRTRFGIATPRILACGLNPHAGEAGHLGHEEIDTIAPAIAALRADGIDIKGPVPADTAFTPRLLAQADVVLAMYHDQGLTALKYAGFGSAVNITLGLPIVRTSVDHGTALDLAGTGRADSGSLQAALTAAIGLAAVGR